MTFMVKERLYLTADRKRLVRHNDPEAAYLACVAGQELSDAEVRQLGIVAFYAAPAAAPVKQGRVPANKMAARPADKTEIKEIIK